MSSVSRRGYLKYVGGAVVAAAAAGGAAYYLWPRPKPKVEVELGPMWWSKASTVPNLTDLLDEFKEEYPDIVPTEFLIGSDPNTESEKRWAAGDPPEIYQNSRWVFQKTLALERVIPLNDVWDEWDLWDKFYLSSVAWNAYDKDIVEEGFKLGETPVYAFPDAVFPSCFFFDMSRFEEVGIDVPKTFEDLKETKKVFEKALPDIDFMLSPLILPDWSFITLGAISSQVIGAKGAMETRLGYRSFKDDDWRYVFELAKEFAQEVISPKSAEMDLALSASALVSRKCVMNGISNPNTMIPVFAEARVPELDLDVIANVKWVDNPSSFGEVSWGGIFMIPKGLDKEVEEAAKTLIGWLWGVPYLEGRGIVGYPGNLCSCSPSANEIILEKLAAKFEMKEEYFGHLFGLDWIPNTDENSFYVNDVFFPDHAPIICDIFLNFLLGKPFDLDAELGRLDEVSKVA